MRKLPLTILLILIAGMGMAQTKHLKYKSQSLILDTNGFKIQLIANLFIQVGIDHVVYDLQQLKDNKITKHDVAIIRGDSILAYCDSDKWVIRDTISTINDLKQAIKVVYEEQQREQSLYYSFPRPDYYIKPKKHKK